MVGDKESDFPLKFAVGNLNVGQKEITMFFTCGIFFWLHWVFAAEHGLSLVAASGGYSLWRCMGFSLPWLLLLWRTGSRRVGFSSPDTEVQ